MDNESKEPANESAAHEFDVAISFLARDEPLARDLAERLAPLRVFVYSKAQEDLAGREGVEAFRSVFREKAQLALVLFRPGWGQSPWTRVEEVAIRDHCLAEGWNHQMFVQLEKGARPPKWVPDSYLYLDLEFGVADLVGAVKARCMELGIHLRILSAAELARQIADRERFDVETAQIIRTTARPLYDTATATFLALKQKVEEIATASGWSMKYSALDRECVVYTDPVSLYLHTDWEPMYTEAHLVCGFFLGQVIAPEDRGRFVYYRQPTEIRSIKLRLVRTRVGWCWQLRDEISTPDAAAEMLAKEFIEARRRQSPAD